MRGYLGRRTLIGFAALFALGLVLFIAGMVSDDRTLRGWGVLAAIVGLVGAMGLVVRWLVFRGVG
jgi:hypothetical protein